MKIIYFAEHFGTPQKITGGDRPYQQPRRLVERGHTVTVVCGGSPELIGNMTKDKKSDLNTGVVDGINVIQIPMPYSNNDSILKRAKTFIKFSLKASRIALREDYDILFATSTPLTDGLPGIIAKTFRKKKFVFEVRDLWPELPKALGLKNPFLLWGMSVLEKKSYQKADACVGLSPGICEGIAKRSPKGRIVKMIPNSSDRNMFAVQRSKEFVIPGVNENDVVALFAGAHGVANGLNSVLDAAAELKSRGVNNIKIVFVGNGKTRQTLIQRAENENLDNCIFLNSIPKKDMPKIMSRADIGLMVLANIPAFYYGTSPNKFFDYIAAALPVVNNYPGWLADMINDNKCGIAVAPNNPVAFADALENLANNPDIRTEYGVNARALAKKEFDRDMLLDQFADFIEEIAK